MRVQQVGVELGEFALQRLDVGMDVPEHEQVACAEIAFRLAASSSRLLLERAARQAQHRVRWAGLRSGRRPCARADTPLMSLTTPPSLMPPSSRTLCSRLISLARMRAELAPVARDQAQLAQVLRRDEAARTRPKRASTASHSLSAMSVLRPGTCLIDVRVDHPGGDAGALQVGVHALPVDAGALHDHQFDAQFDQPGRQRAAVAPETAELPRLALHRAVGLLDQHRHHMQHAVHVDTGHAPVQGSQSKVFHDDAPEVKVPDGTQGDHRSGRMQSAATGGWKTPRIVVDSGLFTVRAAKRSTHMGRAAQQSGVRASPVQVRLGVGVGPSFVMRPQSPSVPPHILHQPQAFMLGGDAWES